MFGKLNQSYLFIYIYISLCFFLSLNQESDKEWFIKDMACEFDVTDIGNSKKDASQVFYFFTFKKLTLLGMWIFCTFLILIAYMQITIQASRM